MLIIYGSLEMGGIETFFVRLSKQRFKSNKKTKILFLLPKHRANFDKYLLQEINKYSEVYYYEDVVRKEFINWRFLSCHMYETSKVQEILADCNQIHVSDIQYGLIANEILREAGLNMPITFGVYHTMEYAWNISKLPYFEQVNRKFLFNVVDCKNIMCFSENTKKIIEERTGYLLPEAKTFRLGVIDQDNFSYQHLKKIPQTIKMCAVGRLADFKTYNLWMPQVIYNLNKKGIKITLDIYGDGELEQQVKELVLGREEYIELKPSFSYSNFKEVVSNYDLFIGSGTAIIEAASLGIPCIIGIESIKQPSTYGFFSEFSKYEYNIQGLPFGLISVEDLIQQFCHYSVEKINTIKNMHIESSKDFTIQECELNIDESSYSVVPYYEYNKLFYSISKIIFQIKLKLFKKSIYNNFK